jgi:leucyl-tRNA synthetase
VEYQASVIEKKWQKFWIDNKTHEPKEDYNLDKKYILSMFPYPSGRIHMGHVRNYTIGDAFARFYRQQGLNVLHPIGWDSFGMPAENAAIKNKVHPKKWTYENINYMTKELRALGLSFSEDREFATSDPLYSKFEQEFMIDLYEKGLLYKKKGLLNWCPKDKTILANEQVIEGCCWRCDTPIVQKDMEQYYLKITDYTDELIDDLEKIKDGWPKQVITMQKNWIGKSEGLELNFTFSDESKKLLSNAFDSFDTFTTRADTIYGITYTALAPEHEIVKYLIENKILDQEKINALKIMQNTTGIDRAQAKKSGVDLGLSVIHPLTKKKIPVWVANFVLTEYGSGAVMAVPAHDDRDYEFAQMYNLEINTVIVPNNGKPPKNNAYTLEGKMINSDQFNGMKNTKAKIDIIKYFEENNLGKKVINFKLKDWGVSRQRYWGAPIPLVKCNSCGTVAEKKENLPITLPDDVQITGDGNPLEKHPTWKHCICPKCGKKAIRETDTLDTFVQSSWYFLRYTASKKVFENKAFDKKEVNYWLGVDHYIGGIEHAILHLLYARFFTKILRDLGYIDFDEPFINLLTQGMVLKDGSKMSKSKGNVVDPDKLIEKYGADTARLFILFAAPPTQELEWNDQGVDGAYKFIKRLNDRSQNVYKTNTIPNIDHNTLNKEEKEARKKVYEALERANSVYLKKHTFNTLIAGAMEAINALNGQKNADVWTEGYFILLSILEPIIPHICWELSDLLFDRSNFTKIALKPEVMVSNLLIMAVSINGKRRSEIEVSLNADKETILALAKEAVFKWLDGKTIIKEILVPKKLINIVIK